MIADYILDKSIDWYFKIRFIPFRIILFPVCLITFLIGIFLAVPSYLIESIFELITK